MKITGDSRYAEGRERRGRGNKLEEGNDRTKEGEVKKKGRAEEPRGEEARRGEGGEGEKQAKGKLKCCGKERQRDEGWKRRGGRLQEG